MLRVLSTITSRNRNRMEVLHIMEAERNQDKRFHPTLIVNAPGFYNLVRFSIDNEDGDIMISFLDSNGKEQLFQIGEANIQWQDDMTREN